jgi:hypothetical protein
MWSYKPLNQARMGLIERHAPPLPSLGGLRRRWHRSCSGETMKVTNLVSLDRNTHLQKNIQLFRLLPLRSLQKVYIKGLKPFFLDPKAENTLPWSPSSL